MVRDEAANRGLSHDRECLQQIGAQLIAAGWEPFTRQVLAQAGWAPGDPVIVDGVRHQEAITTLRALTTPLPIVVIYLDIPASDGIARAGHRESAGKLAPGDAEHPVEQHSHRVRDQADLVLPAVTTAAEMLADRVISHLEAIRARSTEHRHD